MLCNLPFVEERAGLSLVRWVELSKAFGGSALVRRSLSVSSSVDEEVHVDANQLLDFELEFISSPVAIV